MTKVFIDGNQGTTGLKIYERFKDRSDIEILNIPDALRKDTEARREFINKSDVTFLCLPDDAAREAVTLCDNPDTVIIDASTAHRTVEGWAYGFPELSAEHRRRIETGKHIATPGCHAGGFLSLLYPLTSKEIVAPDYPLVCYSLTGYSGGGKKMIGEYEGEDRDVLLDSPRQYGITQNHKHLKEVKHVAGLTRAPIFAPIVSDYAQGMEVSLPLYTDMLSGISSVKEMHEFFSDFYAGQNMVKVLPLDEYAGGFIASNKYANDNRMYIFVGGNDERILLCSIFDNLGKGASGAAVQCMNISLGIDETTGLV
ncbi:MAG: N-acetyl-gamma-glutamyl-phosphate reductase [Ruminococcaceae bacterium]|nr:N-acetyl-gamma-glutamyl-phosphate reductase [Oscillospiraceae bacterium]